MADIIVGRKVEQEILRQRIESKSPELIAILYGNILHLVRPNEVLSIN